MKNNKYENYNLEVGARIRYIRESLNMTREQFSELCDISDSLLTAVELGRKSITVKTLNKICTASNTSADYIVFGESEDCASENILHIISSIPADKRESALIILREYANTVKKDKND